MNEPTTHADRTIALAEDPAAIARCHAVMRELRPHHADGAAFVAQVQRQQAQGYRLAYLESEGEVRAVAGYRFIENLFAGKMLYVDDLVSAPSDRSRGHGGRLLDWLTARAREAGCAWLTLDSGVQRFGAHRFYLRKGMDIASHHFTMKLDAPAGGGRMTNGKSYSRERLLSGFCHSSFVIRHSSFVIYD